MPRILIAATLVLTLSATHIAQADDIDAMRQRLVRLYSQGEGPAARRSLAAMEARVRAAMERSPATREPDRARPDDISNDVLRIFRGVLQMAQIHAAPGGTLTGSAKLKAAIRAELSRGLEWVKPGCERPGNWHPWLIRIPQVMGPTLLLLDGRVDPDLHARGIEAMAGLIGEPTLNGANGVWEARNHLYLGLLQRDADRLTLAMGILLPELTVHNESGILEDYTYQFHGRLLHTSGYGEGFAASAAEMVYLVDGTRWAASNAKKRLFADHLLEHARWVVVGNRYDLSVRGRGVVGNHAPTRHLEAVLLMGALPGPQQRQLRQAAAGLLDQARGTLPLKVAPMADQVAGITTKPLTGFRYCHVSDFAVFRRPDFYTSVRMYSNRLIDYEGNWGQNLSGWFLCYGLTYFSRTGNELWADRRTMAQHLDWDRLPGTTTRVGVRPAAPYNLGTEPFAGGAGPEPGSPAGDSGVCGFVLRPAAGDFVARKSVLFFDRGFIAAGNGITSTAPHPEHVVTTVTQWAAPQENAPLVLSGDRKVQAVEGDARWDNVRWAWLDNVGYAFPDPVTLHGHRRGRLTTLWLDHGNNPQAAAYAYVVLPSASQAETEHFAAEPTVRVTARDDTVHAFETAATGASAAVFWKAGRSGPFAVDQPAIVHLSRRGKGRALAVQNPLHTEERLTVTVDGMTGPKVFSLPPGVAAAARDDRAELKVATAAGRIYRIGLGPGAKVAQPPREDNLPYETFAVEATSEGDVTWLTVRLPAPAARDGWRLVIRGPKGHLHAEMTDADVVERLPGMRARFKWVRRIEKVYEGVYRAILLTDMHMVVRHFPVPQQPHPAD